MKYSYMMKDLEARGCESLEPLVVGHLVGGYNPPEGIDIRYDESASDVADVIEYTLHKMWDGNWSAEVEVQTIKKNGQESQKLMITIERTYPHSFTRRYSVKRGSSKCEQVGKCADMSEIRKIVDSALATEIALKSTLDHVYETVVYATV